MKIRKQYTVTILKARGVAVLTSSKSSWASWLQKNATCCVEMYDCNFREAVDNLKMLKNRGYYISKRRS